MKRSPLAPKSTPVLPQIKGIRLAACEAGIKYKDRKDLMLTVFDQNTTVAGTLTKSKTASAPVEWCRQYLAQGKASALVVNAGNANAFTGMKGMDAVQTTVKTVTDLLDCHEQEVFVASTGVIGEPLDPQTFTSHITNLKKELSATAWNDAAEAIMTTDTYAKQATASTQIHGKDITINGIAKGSGMIAPDMATMLGFIFTNAAIAPEVLQILCSQAVEKSFNTITVDGDTSTSDTVLLFATGTAENQVITDPIDPALADFKTKLNALMLDLAHQIVRDGEGASKFIEITVSGAENEMAAKKIGLSIANSPLVKTAIAGEDPNWGRIVMAVGKSGEAADRDKLAIWFGDIKVATNGERDPSYSEPEAAAYMKGENINIKVDVGIAQDEATVWTCDLTHDYISINADYRS